MPKKAGQADKVIRAQDRKKFDFLEGDPRRIEATTEYPVMYHALGTEPRTEHPFHVYEDISSEPTAVRATLDVTQDAVDTVANEFIKRDINHVVGIGMGTSQFVQQACGPAFWEWGGITTEDRDSVEFLTYNKPYDYEHTAFFAMSGSGATFDTIEATKKAKEQGMYCVAITSVAGSPLTQVTHNTIACAGGFDTGGSDTFHYATRLAASLALACKLGEVKGTGVADFPSLREELFAVPNLMADRWDELDARCRSIAKYTCRLRSVIIVGAGPNFGSAEEMELKFEEMASIPAKSMVPTRHLHGALGLTDEKILTILLHPKNNTEKWFDQIAKFTSYVKTPSMAIVPDSEENISSMMDYIIRTPVENEHLFALYVVPAIQLFPYYCAVEQGNLNPDCQRSNIPKYARAWSLVLKPGGH
ncbi:MAG TPA: SIS domain-containing protein [Candidatus Lokiarchaeia archaeon]|nr:SIS domain-containing protein [Candidatus Lokiarchaeia archaeon]